MYTAGLAPFYASNFSLWSAAYCSASGPAAGGCFPLDAAVKKPSFCIADILHAGGEAAAGAADSLPGGPGGGMPAALGAVHHGGPYAVLTKDTLPQTYKRKRSWSRAVFSNLQRKGLEKRFEIQKYVTKPDRKQLAAMLGLTDAQVKVWFQNRRMKWRHSKEAQAQKDKEPPPEPEPSAQRSGAPPAGPGEPERSPSRSDGDSDSSDAESLDMAPSDTERTEGAERSLPAAPGPGKSSGSTGLPSPPPPAASPEPRSGL
ncbi:hypothetical protein HGM15179_001004 [Zosterops borbonicus]|uniref:H2.0-like homeobox protein n=1 Tax=Zosterops borbonicus TaxID=364589 RepID=A0A8K1GYT1_9PASS|nr:hypothetical protein HGM15179_001004 [Zosterops borbonicus]